MSRSESVLELSILIYRILLNAYPEAFRRQYGESMIQVFRDLGRKAVRSRGALGIIGLWLRILPDVVYSVIEQNSNEGNRAVGRITTVAGALYLLVLLATVAYASVAFREFYVPPDFSSRVTAAHEDVLLKAFDEALQGPYGTMGRIDNLFASLEPAFPFTWGSGRLSSGCGKRVSGTALLLWLSEAPSQYWHSRRFHGYGFPSINMQWRPCGS